MLVFPHLEVSWYQMGSLNVSSMNRVAGRPKRDFEPSMRILSRVTRILLERNSVGRTELAQVTNLQYGRLAKYLEWLAHRMFIEFLLQDGKVLVRLTPSGREFSQKIRKPDFEAF